MKTPFYTLKTSYQQTNDSWRVDESYIKVKSQRVKIIIYSSSAHPTSPLLITGATLKHMPVGSEVHYLVRGKTAFHLPYVILFLAMPNNPPNPFGGIFSFSQSS